MKINGGKDSGNEDGGGEDGGEVSGDGSGGMIDFRLLMGFGTAMYLSSRSFNILFWFLPIL